jgi:hypothetical protein
MAQPNTAGAFAVNLEASHTRGFSNPLCHIAAGKIWYSDIRNRALY